MKRSPPALQELQRLAVLDGCPCVVLRDEAQAIEVLNGFISARRGGYSVAINAEKMLCYGSRADIRGLIDASSLPYPDGVGAVLALRWLHGRRARKINMPMACIEGAEHHGWRLFVLGAREEVNRAAVEEMKRRSPGLNIVGRVNGYERDELKLAAVRDARPDVVLVALGSPAQERFAARLLSVLPHTFVVGCGGALDVLSGRTRRAPRFMVDNGLEWLYRLSREPSRWRRQIVLPWFLVRLAIAACRTHFNRLGATVMGRHG